MIYIISGTDRPGSNSLKVSNILKTKYEAEGKSATVLDLKELELNQLDGRQYGDNEKPTKVKAVIKALLTAEGIVVVCPEYNGSMPGALKYFIDHWDYPASFEYKPVAFVGIGGRFGGLRPVEHLQQVFGYRNAFIYPKRVFISNVWEHIKDDTASDEIDVQLAKQTKGFLAFTKALIDGGLHPNHQKG